MSKKMLIGVTILAVIVVAGIAGKVMNPAVSETSADTWEKINQDQMLGEMEKDHVTIVDLREPELYAEGHIPGAINIPFEEFQSRYQELDKRKRTVFVCHTGPMGDASSQFLLEKGFSDLANLTGGMAKWDGPVTGTKK
jgi:rhodanese-related sulfurtransferase